MKPLNIRIKAPKQPEPQVTQPVVQPTQPAVQPTTSSKITFKKKIGFDGSVHSHPTQNAQTVKNQLVIFNDAKSQMEDQYENIYVFPYKDDKKVVQQEILRVFIRGRENVDEDDNAFFPGKYLKCRIEFREDYPENPPKFYIEKLKNGDAFRSMNVYADGEVCQYTLNPDYWAKKKYDLCTIVKSVESMLYSPNSSDPANLIMQELFSENENQYWQIQASQAKNFYDESDLKS